MMKKGIVFAILVLLTIGYVNGKPTHPIEVTEDSTPWFSYNFDALYLFRWQITGLTTSTPIISVNIQLFSLSWVGFGLSPKTGSMVDADMIITRFDTSPSGVSDYYATGHVPPSLDTALGGQENVLSFNISQDAASGTTIANWTRYLNTGDTVADYPITNEYMQLVWAYGTSNVFQYHSTNRGQLTLNLFTGQAPPPSLSDLVVPPGFQLSIVTQVPNARNMALSAGGVVYVGNFPGSSLYAFNLSDPSNVVELANNLDNPNGVAYFKGSLYVATITAITRYDDIDSAFQAGSLPQGKVLATFPPPPDSQHSWKTLTIGPDGNVYSSINSPCNTCLDGGQNGTMFRFSATDGSGMQTIIRGIRDMQGLTFTPTGDLFWTDNGRDELGNYWPPDELNYISHSYIQNLPSTLSHYGFPYCYGQNEPDQTINPSLNCLSYTPALLNLPAHIAALGIHYYTGTQFPAPYANNFFIAAHGSWNRQPPLYSQLLFVEVDPVTGETTASIFLRGFGAGGTPSGRLVSVIETPDGSLLLSDDLRGYIYKVQWVGF